jgi:molybdopterin-biosynthesis enzyme MoeA-like protein
VLRTPGTWVPIAVVNSQCFMLPGVPRLFKMLIENAIGLPTCGQARWTKLLLYTSMLEGDIAHVLDQAERLEPGVTIGSYPQTNNLDANVIV